jgi:predicted DNA-binding ribbon-helix-helix protein
MIRKTVSLEKSEYDALRKIARQRKTSLSALGRECTSPFGNNQ